MRSSEVCFVAPDACRNVLGRDTEPQFTRDQRFIGASLAEVKYVMGRPGQSAVLLLFQSTVPSVSPPSPHP